VCCTFILSCVTKLYAHCAYFCALYVCNTAANVESLELEDGEEEDLVSRFAYLITYVNKVV